MDLSELPNFNPSSIPPSAFNYERPRHFIQSQPCFQAPSYDSVVKDSQENQNQQNPNSPPNSLTSMESPMTDPLVVQTQAQFQYLSLSQNQSNNEGQANGTTKSSPSSSSFCSSISTSSAVPPLSSAASKTTSSLRPTLRSSFTLTPISPYAASVPCAPLSFSVSSGLGSATLPANQDPVLAPTDYHSSAGPSQSAFSPSISPNSKLCSQIPLSSPPTSIRASPVSLSCSSVPQSSSQKQIPPTVISLPTTYQGTPHILPKPTLKKPVTPRPSSSRSTDEDIQGSKDALIQDLEKKLRTKEARRRISQKLSYEERMARRLLGPEGPISMFDQGGVFEPQPVQPVSPEGRYTGGLWGRRHTQSDERGDEEAAIQEKCYAPRFLQIPADLSVEEGRFCRIDFKVGGLPMPDVTWYLDGKAVRPDDFHKMLVCEKGMHSFILEITTMRDAGVYECVARNRAGESRFTMRLNVIAQEVLQPPTFVQKLLNSRALEGDTVSLECKIYASPTPQVFWKKDKEMLHIDPSRMSLYQDGSGRHRLLIEWVRKSDAGWYTLSAINVAGMSSCNARLDVGTATTLPIKPVAPASKLLKLPSGSRAQVASIESFPRRPALPYESEEL
ncbi:hypothetical protein fugu_013574 [Takifugu bimaculatus]|uniref:Ig-like domain-containing protein n=1 Tax=Takifugu bimaculatus TaxID=433685 RepID=A0A4Z2C4W8_9TELE|nr:hypothetical protein fugu_013574 [Takifugu bimaculatus]